MDISEVYMVRSAKGNDMLCVDSYLYYYDDRGLKTFRWSCNKRKDRVLPCKSRIITKLVDMDETKHVVVKVFEEHSHERCTAGEISKAFERKRLANLAGKPCTLEAKAEKRKLLRSHEEFYANCRAVDNRMKVEPEGNSDSDYREGEVQSDGIKPEIASVSCENTNYDGSIQLKYPNIYMLKTSHGRDMICIDGYLYRLEGRSQANTYRWECTKRRDDGCKARVQTSRIRERRHILKSRRFNHTHPPYAQDKLLKLFKKHQTNCSLSQSETKIPAMQLFRDTDKVGDNLTNSSTISKEAKAEQTFEDIKEFEEINLANSTKLLKDMMAPAVCHKDSEESNFKDSAMEVTEFEAVVNYEQVSPETDIQMDIEFEAKQEKEDSKHFLTDVESGAEDPLEGDTTQSELDLSQVCLMPSSKGNKLLCIDNFLYHFDSKSANRKRIYWTCVHRRDKIHNCKARVTTDAKIDNDLKIIKVSGPHMHPNDVEKIKQRLCNEFVVKAANATDMKPSEFLDTMIQELSGNIKKMVMDSKDAIRRKISKMRYKMKQKFSHRKFKFEEDCESISSLSSALCSDNGEDLPTLPMKLEEMKEEVKGYCKEKDEDTINYEESMTDHEIPKTRDYNYGISNQTNEEVLEEGLGDQSGLKYELVSTMDLKKVSTLRSAKGGELLCIDNYLYHVKSARDFRTYWECIKCKNKILKCKSRVITVMTPKGYVVKKVTNQHTHAANKAEVEKRLRRSLNSRTGLLGSLKNKVKTHVGTMVAAMSKNVSTIRKNSAETRSVMKLYSVSDGPPSLAVRMTLEALKIPYELVNIDFCAGEHMTEEYAKMNPQKEIPVLDDDGFYLSESIAIMQYLCDKYAPHCSLYPKQVSKRAIVNQRLCFNMGFYYASISAHVMAPIFFDYPRTETTLKKVNNSLAVFETYLKRTKFKYAAADNLTIADFPLITSTLCLQAIGFDLTPFPWIKRWYDTFKVENPHLWKIGNDGMREIEEFDKNPPALYNMNHPFHPTRKDT